MEVIQSPLMQAEERITQNLAVGAYAKTFKKNKLIVIDQFLSTEFVKAHFYPEIEHCTPHIHRVFVPKFKKSGSVSSQNIKQFAPQLFALYHSEKFKCFIEKIVGESIQHCPKEDPHSVALYNYTEKGDHIGVHYDKSFYRGRRYTVLLGMIQNSVASKLVCYLGANKLNRRKNPMEVYTHPGTLVIFDGDVLWHEVTPLAENERRVILTMEYVTDNRMTHVNRFMSNFKDRLLYFGKKS